MNRTCRVGVHGRNDIDFHDADFRAIQEAKIEMVKMMSQTRIDHFKRLKEIRPDIELITRLYDDRFGKHGPPNPQEFAGRMIPVMKQLQPYSTKFEVHNEPNHLDRIEGWGDSDDDARSFNAWFLRVYDLLKRECPWAQLGFPGLAIPHRDLEWIEICRPAVQKSDWLGVHCYWQTPEDALHNHLSDFWGLRFKYYHEKFPDKIIDLTEVGNSNVQNGIPFSETSHAREFTEYLTECFKYPYLNSAAFFILSSPDPTWDGFTWRSQDGRHHQVVRAIRDMHRPHWVAAKVDRAVAQAEPAGGKAVGQETDAAKEQMAQLQRAFRELQTQLQQKEVQTSQLQTQARQLQSQNNQLQSRLQQLQAQVATIPAAAQASNIRRLPASTSSAVTTFTATSTSPQPVTRQRPIPTIENLTQTLTRHPSKKFPSRPLQQIDRIIVHHTAVASNIGAERIAEFLVKNHNRPGIGYHYFITTDGVIQQTNLVTAVTLQSTPEYNPVAIGVGFAGNFNDAIPTPQQIEAGAQLIAWIIYQLQLSPQAVFGHKELINTQSPGLQWDAGARWGQKLKQQIQAILAGQ